MSIPLEDGFADVLGKAVRGLGRDAAGLSSATGIDKERIERVLQGEYDRHVVDLICPHLGLNSQAVQALAEGTYVPEPVAVEGLMLFQTPFDEMIVNSYLVWDPSRRLAAVFDTGTDIDELVAAAAERDVRIEHIFITHNHGDHILDLDRLREKTHAPVSTSEKEPVEGARTFTAGKEFTIGNLHIETRLTWGHSAGGITYVVRGLQRDLAICGDALFAGSMGGGKVSYQAALETNLLEIFSLPAPTIVCPGHGPMTSVGEEKDNNPFFASGFKE